MPEKDKSHKAGRNRTSLSGMNPLKVSPTGKRGINHRTAQHVRHMNFLMPGCIRRMKHGESVYRGDGEAGPDTNTPKQYRGWRRV